MNSHELTPQESQALLKRARKQRLNFEEKQDADRAVWKTLARHHEEEGAKQNTTQTKTTGEQK